MQTYQWINETKSRFYTITIEKEPNKIALNYQWGSCNSNRGGKKRLVVNTLEEANKYIANMLKRRKSRGYCLIAPLAH